MNAATAQQEATAKTALLFVDDEPRVLKSMRAMFRRDYEVYLANSGQEALEIVADKPIQVVVSDQRMPHMTGVEVLSQIKQSHPGIVRILLTGYADLEAIEASLNEAEVFKYLMKPCPADEVRAAVQGGLEQQAPPHTAEVITLTVPGTDLYVAEEVSVDPVVEEHIDLIPAAEAAPNGSNGETLEISTEQNETELLEESAAPSEPLRPAQAQQASTTKSAPALGKLADCTGNLVLLGNRELQDQIAKAIPKVKIYTATSVQEASEIHKLHPLSVLVADVPTDRLSALSRDMQTELPDVVTLTVSDRSDASLLIDLINSGHVFRFLVKPVQAGRLHLTLNSAFARYASTAGLNLPGPTKPSLWQRIVAWLMGEGS